MKARPILFSGPMVRALLAGTKTQTRRGVKGVPSWDHYGKDIMDWDLSGIHQGDFGEMAGTDRWFLDVQTDVDDNSRRETKCPYGAPGDVLYVRETLECANGEAVGYPADGTWLPNTDWRWQRPKLPAIHMPRWASRLTLEITDVRVERLQDISEADALAEGLNPGSGESAGMWGVEGVTGYWFKPETAYFDLWNAINGQGSVDANPWCWCVSFACIQANVDAVLRDREAA